MSAAGANLSTIPSAGGAPEVAAAPTAAASRQLRCDDVRKVFEESYRREGGKWLRRFLREEYRFLLDIDVAPIFARGTLTRSVGRGLSHAPLITAPTPGRASRPRRAAAPRARGRVMPDTRLPDDAEMYRPRQAGAFICQCATPAPGPLGECMNRHCRKLIDPRSVS